MGRIRTAQIKRLARELIEHYGDRFTVNFESNQQAVGRLITATSKKLKNKVTGYVTSLVKQGNKARENA